MLSMGALLFVAACGGASGGTPPATTTATNTGNGAGATPAQTGAAAFTTSNLTVTPDTAKPGDRIMVGVTVTNTGTEQGTYTVTVKDHDGTVLGTKDVTLAGGGKEDISLHISVSTAGAHMVMIDKLWHNLTIQAAAANTSTPPPTQTTTPPPTTTPPAAGAGFAVSGLDVSPGMPDVGEAVVVSFKVTNNGQAGTYHAEVKIDGTSVATQDIPLAAGETKVVNVPAKAPAKEGSFTFSVGDQSLKITVMAM